MQILLPLGMEDTRGAPLSNSKLFEGEEDFSPTYHLDDTALLPEAESPASLASPDQVFEAAEDSSDSESSCSDKRHSSRFCARKALDFSDDCERVPSSASTTILAETPEMPECQEDGNKLWPLRRRVGGDGSHRLRHRERTAAYAAALVASTSTGAHLRRRDDSASSQDTSRTSRTSASTPLGQLGGALQVALERRTLESGGSRDSRGSAREAFPSLASIDMAPPDSSENLVADDSWYDAADFWSWMAGTFQPGGGGTWDEVRTSIEHRSMASRRQAASQYPDAYRAFADSRRPRPNASLAHHLDPEEFPIQGGWS